MKLVDANIQLFFLPNYSLLGDNPQSFQILFSSSLDVAGWQFSPLPISVLKHIRLVARSLRGGWGLQPSCLCITWELGNDAEARATPRPPESETSW